MRDACRVTDYLAVIRYIMSPNLKTNTICVTLPIRGAIGPTAKYVIHK